MTLPLEHVSGRPELVVDAWAFRLFDPVSKTYVGRVFSRDRTRSLSALPMRGGPPQRILPDVLVNDAWGFLLSDPSGNIIGKPAVIVHRRLTAAP